MTLVIPTVAKLAYLSGGIVEENLTLKLYSNNKVPAVTDTAGSYTEVTGGGYVAKSLLAANWIKSEANPSIAVYAAQDFVFTGATGAPGTVYGYFIINGSGVIRWAERFEEAVLPFTPAAGTLVRITPRIQCS